MRFELIETYKINEYKLLIQEEEVFRGKLKEALSRLQKYIDLRYKDELKEAKE